MLLGIASGLLAGYTLNRSITAARLQRGAIAPLATPDATRYAAARRTLMLAGILRSVASSCVVAFAVAPRADAVLARLPPAVRLATFIVLVQALEFAREWPIDYVEDYALERRFATSERDIAVWQSDRFKELGVSSGVTFALVTLASALIAQAPRAWLPLAIAVTPLLLALANVVAPTYIMPLFNTYVPLEGPLAERIRRLATRYGVGDATLLRFDMSRQTKKANAFVTGVFGTERIVLADTLIDAFAEDETLFVVAHELGHYVRRDPWVSIGLGTLAAAGSLALAQRIAARRGRALTTIAGAMPFGFTIMLAQLALGPAFNAFSRAIERRADRFAIDATSDPLSGARAFRRLREQNLAEDEGPRWAELLFASHPSLKSRIAALERAALV